VSKTVVFGYGNSLRSDDGLALAALDCLESKYAAGDVEFIRDRQLLPEPAALACQADVLFFVDASQAGKKGEVRVEPVEADGAFPSPSHHLSPSSFLTLLQYVFGVAPRAYVATLRGECFEVGEGLSPETAQMLPSLVRAVESVLGETGAIAYR
jgi:hydrogenase maturation protease